VSTLGRKSVTSFKRVYVEGFGGYQLRFFWSGEAGLNIAMGGVLETTLDRPKSMSINRRDTRLVGHKALNFPYWRRISAARDATRTEFSSSCPIILS